jgi:hypothetical protein
MIKDHGRLMRDDPHYADRAERVSRPRATSRRWWRQRPHRRQRSGPLRRIAFHSPCSLTHAPGPRGRDRIPIIAPGLRSDPRRRSRPVLRLRRYLLDPATGAVPPHAPRQPRWMPWKPGIPTSSPPPTSAATPIYARKPACRWYTRSSSWDDRRGS